MVSAIRLRPRLPAIVVGLHGVGEVDWMGDAMSTVLSRVCRRVRPPPRKVRCREDVPPSDRPLTRVWTVFHTREASAAIEAVKLLAWEGSVHPMHPKAKARQPYIDVQFGKRAWRVHVDYSER